VLGAVPGRRGLLLVAQVERGVPGEDADRLDAGVPQHVEPLGGEFVAHHGQRVAALVLGVRHRGGQHGAHHLAPLLAGLDLAGDREILGGKEQPEDVRVVPVPEGAEEGGGRELLLLVDVDVDHVVDVDRELDPRAPERDDPRREEPLAVGVDVLLEHHARRAVQLADHHPLRAVDDERPERGHDRQLAEVDLLLDDVLRALLALDLLEDHQLQRGLEGDGVGHVALDALLDGILGLAQRVPDEVEGVLPVHVGDREEVAEHPLQGDVLAGAADVVRDQQRVERAGLDVEEVRHRHAALVLRERDHGPGLSHGSLSCNTKGPGAGASRRMAGAPRGSDVAGFRTNADSSCRLAEIG